ncbi:hypothetical protein ACQY0O_005902 [Thecaphora frezii]
MFEALRSHLPSAPHISLPSMTVRSKGPMVVFRTTPDVALVMLALLTYALVHYVVFVHHLLQTVPAFAEVTPVKQSEQVSDYDSVLTASICKTDNEDRIVGLEDNHRLPDHKAKEPSQETEAHLITPPQSPGRERTVLDAEKHEARNEQMRDEIISGTVADAM